MSQKKRGILIVFSGFSGSGKGTVMKELLLCYPDRYALSISATTRKPRALEEDGREYFFNGTPKEYVEKQLEAGKDVILEIEIQGALKVKQRFPDTLLLFVTPQNADILKERLIGRGTESEEVVYQRLSQASEEALRVEEYDYLIINDTIEDCVKEVHSIIQNEHRRVSRNQEFINRMKEELKRFSKGE